MATFTQHLRDRGEDGLAALLAVRPDLAAPPPSSVRSLAARAANRSSLERVLAGVDLRVLSVLEAVLALDGLAPDREIDAADVGRALGSDPADLDQVAAAVHHALALALLWTDEPSSDGLHASPGIDEVLGPYPAGLGPTLSSCLARRSPAGITRLADELGVDDEPSADGPAADLTGPVARHLARPETVVALLDRAPPGARAVLEALAWGPPVGLSPAAAPNGTAPGPARTAVDWLLRHGLLSVGDPQHVVLPREIALALRGGRTHRTPPTQPRPAGRATDSRTVDSESARQAEEAVRWATVLVDTWGAEPPPVLRSGGLGARELRRLAGHLEVPEATAALVVEVAGAAGLVTDDGEAPPALAPTTDADEWLRTPLTERWVVLADAWLTAERAAWLVGTRDDRGSLRAALDPESRRPWAPRLRRSVLDVLVDAAAAQPPVALSPAEVHEVLRWRTPRAVAPLTAVEAVLTEAGALGVLGAGVPSSAGHALLAAHAPLTGHASLDPAAALDPATALDPAAALEAQLAPAVDEVLLQGDLTGIVPGRPSPALAALLDRATQVESRGAGLTVRFTETSVRRALDQGSTAEALLADLSRHARTGVPQPLEYLVLDAARRHGRVRAGIASSYLRSDDPALLTGLTEDRALVGLGLLRLAPTVIVAQVPPSVLLAALRERGLAPVAEDPSGQVVVSVTPPHRARRGRRGRGHAPPRASAGAGAAGVAEHAAADEAQRRRLHRLARELLAADRRENADPAVRGAGPRGGVASGRAGAGGAVDGTTASPAVVAGAAGPDDVGQHTLGVEPGTPDPVLSLALLREAAAEGREVWLEMVGTGGVVTRRRVRPVRVDAGRVRAVDTEREAELTVAVHRIAAVTAV